MSLPFLASVVSPPFFYEAARFGLLLDTCVYCISCARALHFISFARALHFIFFARACITFVFDTCVCVQ